MVLVPQLCLLHWTGLSSKVIHMICRHLDHLVGLLGPTGSESFIHIARFLHNSYSMHQLNVLCVATVRADNQTSYIIVNNLAMEMPHQLECSM